MPRIEAIRSEVLRLLREVPFQPFALNFENGDRVIIEHPENIAFDPTAAEGTTRADKFNVLSSRMQLYSSFAKVTSVAVLDRGELNGD